MNKGWLTSISALRGGKSDMEFLKEQFPDMPKIGVPELNKHMDAIGNFFKFKPGAEQIKFMSSKFRERLEDHEDDIYTMNGYIDILKAGIEQDLMVNYQIYLDGEMSNIIGPLLEYAKSADSDEVGEIAMKALNMHIFEISRYADALVEKEMNKIRLRLGFKEEGKDFVMEKSKKSIFSIIKAQ